MSIDLTDALFNAEMELRHRMTKRLMCKRGTDSVFRRWLRIYYGITVTLHLCEKYLLTWEVESYSDPEKAIMFKLRY